MANIQVEGRVLLVDDQPDRAKNLLLAMRNSPFLIQTRSEVSDLEATLGPGSDWDCVLCNIDLSNVSWAFVRRAMRKFDVQVPVIVIADERDSDSMSTALALGAADFIVRPKERLDLLQRAIERSVYHHRLQRELLENKESLERTNTQLRHSLKILEQDQQAGRQVQMAMLPAGPLKTGEYWFSHKIYTSLYLSGDFTDYFQVGDDQVVFFLADVSGHGSSSAFATVLLKNLFARKRSDYLRRDDPAVADPVAMLELANLELVRLDFNKYATMVVGVVDFRENTLRYSIAGHLPLPILMTDDSIDYLDGGGPPVGLMAEASYSMQSLTLPEKFMLSVMSDGILELIDDADLIAKEQLLLDRLKGPVDKPSLLANRLQISHVDQADIPDDVAALFISRGLR